MGTASDVAFSTAGEVFEHERKRGACAAEAMQVAVRVLRAHRSVEIAALRDRRHVPAAAMIAVNKIATYYGVSIQVIRSRNRGFSMARIREEMAYVLHRKLKLSLHDVGSVLAREHSSILTAVRRFEARMKDDDVLRARAARVVPTGVAA